MSPLTVDEARHLTVNYYSGQQSALYRVARTGQIPCPQRVLGEINDLSPFSGSSREIELSRLAEWVRTRPTGSCDPAYCLCDLR
ncbi:MULTISPECIES: hypothetical protein [Streptomyces]|uniref:hypothetical protein n=1 Tax=Streptomyces lycopersici TaxID=2974589 RepID=UPI0021CEDB83|nr:hypothetical protein [Streptomyces sp. NEAU-383]